MAHFVPSYYNYTLGSGDYRLFHWTYNALVSVIAKELSKQPLTILAKDYLKRIRKSGHNPFDPRIEQGRGMRALKLWWGR